MPFSIHPLTLSLSLSLSLFVSLFVSLSPPRIGVRERRRMINEGEHCLRRERNKLQEGGRKDREQERQPTSNKWRDVLLSSHHYESPLSFIPFCSLSLSLSLEVFTFLLLDFVSHKNLFLTSFVAHLLSLDDDAIIF